MTPATIRPRYKAVMIFLPGRYFTKNVPMMEATIETAPKTSGYSTMRMVSPVAESAPIIMVATMVTA